MRVLSVKHFEKFQHYKDRAPAWIKLYNAVLDDYAFLSLSDATRSHLMLIWLLASRHDNKIPDDPAYIARAIHAHRPVDLDALIAAGFLARSESEALAEAERPASTRASKTLAERTDSAMPEKEKEEELELPPLPRGAADATPESDPAVAPPAPPVRLAVETTAAKVPRALVPTPAEAAVLERYREVHPRRRPGSDADVRAIRKALAAGYSVDELGEAIVGNAEDEWHAERAKHELPYVFRDRGLIDQFRALHARGHAPLRETNPALYAAMGGV